MRTLLFALILWTLFCFKSNGENDTLRLYNPSTVYSQGYSPTSYPAQQAWFNLPKPALVKGFIFTTYGDSGASVRVSFLGHEGGVSLAQLVNPVISPFTLTKVVKGKEKTTIMLDSPGVLLNNNQFFLYFDQFSGNCRIVTDQTDHPKYCSSSDGGTYYFQYVKSSSDNNWYLANSQNRAFAIDVILEYVSKESRQIFKNMTASAGIDENLGNSSLAAADYNNDGFLDLLISGKFYQNNKNGTFTDITSAKGIINKYSGISANAFVDMDNDGDLDIILFGGDTSVLFINSSGNFTEHILNLPNFKAFLSFSFADINNDRFPDLFVSQLWSTYPEAQPNYLFFNDANLNFSDQTTRIYPGWDGTWNYPNGRWDPANNIIEKNRNSRGSQWVDFDSDGDPDLYVVNYFLHQDEFYRNNGDGTFTDICVSKGIDRNKSGANHGTGVDWYDYDNDGDFDLLLPQFAHPRFIGPYDHRGTTIYRNEGGPNFDFTDLVGQINNFPGLVAPNGIELEETHAGGAWGDANNDGLADILLTVFYGCRYIDFYEQQQNHTFKLKTFDYGLDNINTGTDLIWLDYDNDGLLDIGSGDKGKFRLYKNSVYNDKRFLELDLRSTSANTFAIGAKVKLYASGQVYTQEVGAGRGQKMQKPYRLHFGLGYASAIDSVVVFWPSVPQKKETFTGLELNGFYTLTEGGSVTMSNQRHEAKESEVIIFPNPAKETLCISLNLVQASTIKIEILNSLLQQVEILYNGQISAGLSKFIWNCQNAKGIYFCRISQGASSSVYKLIIGD